MCPARVINLTDLPLLQPVLTRPLVDRVREAHLRRGKHANTRSDSRPRRGTEWMDARSSARRSGDRAAIHGYIGSGDSFDRAVSAFASAYADQTERDHERCS
jgi:hypothetical protein